MEFLDIKAAIDYGLTLKHVRNMKKTYGQINQLVWTKLHRLVRGISYLFNSGLIHAHSVLFSSDRN